MDKDPPPSIFLAAPKKRLGLCKAFASTPPLRIFPEAGCTVLYALANLVIESSTRRDDLLLDENTIQRMWIMRKYLADMNPVEAMEFVEDKIKKTLNNEEFLISMNS